MTGAGRGIGRAYALELARRGASVVVNDIAGAPALALVEEIAAAGGSAIACVVDIADPGAGEMLAATASNSFGGIDAVIANASINSKRKPFPELTRKDLEEMLEVNIFGAWSLLQAAWPLLCAHGRGRVLLTTSQAALYGMATLAEYATAKGAMLGLMRTLALEGAAAGIKVNAIAPAAATRITEETVTDAKALGMLRELQPPHLVAPVAAVLVHDQCPVSGEIFVAGGAHVARVFVGETRGLTMPQDEFTAEAVLASVASVREEAGYRIPRDISETGDLAQKAEIMARLRAIGLIG